MTLEQQLKQATVEIFKEQFGTEITADTVTINITKKEHTGDYTIVVFPLIKFSKQSPEQTADVLGNGLKAKTSFIESFNVIKGFLNLSLTDAYWLNQLQAISDNPNYGELPLQKEKVVLEYCGPNTNKPLHIGHVRNMLLGFSMSEILKAAGYDVTKVNIYNDRGIAIAKSMAAYKREGLERGHFLVPSDRDKKGDHFVGDYYVKFNTISTEDRNEFYQNVSGAIDSIVENSAESRKVILERVPDLKKILSVLSGEEQDDQFKDNPDVFLRGKLQELKTIGERIAREGDPDVIKCVECIDYVEELIASFLEKSIFSEAVEMVQKWEAGDAETISLWKQMNAWVYTGFQETFNMIGVDFQKDYYESETYKLGKDIVEEGLQKEVFYKRKDGAVAVDLTAEGLDEKVLLRADGTSIYITQDLATADLRYNEFHMDKMIYVVANEQDYHFKVLKFALLKLGKAWAEGIYHLSYGLVESPTGRFKSREGKTADADDLISEVLRIAEERTKELGKIEGFSEDEARSLYKTIGMGALKYLILRVNPYKKMIFNPEESIDFQGQTGPFIQYTHTRIRAIMRKVGEDTPLTIPTDVTLHDVERELLKQINEFENVVRSSAANYDPSEVANYVYTLAKTYNKFYHEMPVLNAEKESEKLLRVALSNQTGVTIKKSMKLLGIDVPERM